MADGSVFVALGLAAFAMTACRGAYPMSPNPREQAAPPSIRTAVGPVPGPEKNIPRPTNPYENSRDARTEGRQLFVRFNCSGCHGGRAGGGMGPSLRDVVWLYGSEDAQVFSSIAEGRAHGMPSWGTKLTEDEVWKLVAYVKSLRTPDEVDPPD